MPGPVIDLSIYADEAALLRDLEGLSTEETAEQLGLRAGAVKVRLHRARLKLRESLAGYLASRTEAEAD